MSEAENAMRHLHRDLLLVLLPLIVSACSQPDLAANQIRIEGHGATVSDDGKMVVSYVSAAEPGWLVIHADADGAPGPVMGYTPVQVGEHNEVPVEIAPTDLAWRVHVVLYVDNGAAGKLEVPGADTPALNAHGVVVSLRLPMYGDLSWVEVEDQQLGDGSTVVIRRVFSSGPGILNIHASDRTGIPSIGWAPLQPGENVNVVIEVELESESETLGAMIHSDLGTLGEYDGFRVDPPATNPDGDILVVDFIASRN